MAPYIRAPASSKASRNSTLMFPTKNPPLSPTFSPIHLQYRRQTSTSPIMGSAVLTKNYKNLGSASPTIGTSPITNGSLKSRNLLPPSSGSFYLTNKLLKSIRSQNIPMMTSLLSVMTPSQVNHPHITGETALHEACKSGNVAAVQALLEVPGIRVNIQDNFGYSPVMLAAYCCHRDVLDLLLDLPEVELDLHLEQVAGGKPGPSLAKRLETKKIISEARTRREMDEARDTNGDKNQKISKKTKSTVTSFFSLLFSKISIKSIFNFPINQAQKIFRRTFKRSGPKRRKFGSKGYSRIF